MDTSGKNSDLMEILIINLGDAREPVDNQILRLMNVLLSSQTDVREKQRVMMEEFHIAMTAELEVEVEALCNLSQLHVDKALQVANLRSSAEPRQPLRVLKYRQGVASELLCRCRYFEVYRMIVNTERRQKVHYRADAVSFRVLLCVNGCGMIRFENTEIIFYKGDCIFVPADSVMLSIHGQAQFLDVRG